MGTDDAEIKLLGDENGSANDDVDFQNWLKENPSGYLINRIEPPKIHRATCDYKMSATGNQKICSRSLTAMTLWASVNDIAKLVPCTFCFGLPPITVIQQSDADQDDFNPCTIKDAQDRILASILVRQGQAKFRRALLDAYEARCAFTGCRTVELLDATHVVPYAGPGTNHVQNGLLLRTDIHTLFDLGLLGVDVRTMTILVSPKLCDPDYASLAGRQVLEPSAVHSRPSHDALEWHRVSTGLAWSNSPNA